jgi:hypothetical protein
MPPCFTENSLRSLRNQRGGNRASSAKRESHMRRFRRVPGSYFEAATPRPQLYRGVAHLFFMHGSVARRSLCAPNR